MDDLQKSIVHDRPVPITAAPTSRPALALHLTCQQREDLLAKLKVPLPKSEMFKAPFVVDRFNEVFGVDGWDLSFVIIEKSPVVLLGVFTAKELNIRREAFGGGIEGGAAKAFHRDRRDRGGARVKERPILFSGPMVRATLDGRKTQTRRTLEPRWTFGDGSWQQVSLSPEYWSFSREKKHVNCIPCPYGQPGDRLWVRETWMPDGADVRFGMMKRGDIPWAVRYAASEPDLGKMFKWHPSIHMPRAASRLNLEITKIRVERIRDISADDCASEGSQYLVSRNGDDGKPLPEGKVHPMLRISGPYPPIRYIEKNEKDTHRQYSRAYFASLWDSINFKRGFGWEKNPWVWVVEFKRVEASA